MVIKNLLLHFKSYFPWKFLVKVNLVISRLRETTNWPRYGMLRFFSKEPYNPIIKESLTQSSCYIGQGQVPFSSIFTRVKRQQQNRFPSFRPSPYYYIDVPIYFTQYHMWLFRVKRPKLLQQYSNTRVTRNFLASRIVNNYF